MLGTASSLLFFHKIISSQKMPGKSQEDRIPLRRKPCNIEIIAQQSTVLETLLTNWNIMATNLRNKLQAKVFATISKCIDGALHCDVKE